LPKPATHMQSGECVTHRAPFRYRKLYARPHLAMKSCECPKGEACRLNSAGRPPIRRSLLPRHPLGFGIGPRTSEKLSLSSVSAVSRLAGLSRSFRHGRTASLSGHLDCTMNLRPPSITVGLRRLSVVTCATLLRSNRASACMISALDCRRMVPSYQDFPTAPSLNSCFRASPDSVLAEPSLSFTDFFPDSPGRLRFD